VVKKVKFFIVLALLAVAFSVVAVPALAAESCPGCADKGRFVVENQSDQPAFLYLNGADYYYFSLAPGETRTFTIYVGSYNFTANVCKGVSESGSFYQGKGESTLTVFPCAVEEVSELIVPAAEEAKLVEVAIVNPLSVATSVRLTGDQGDDYYFMLAPGETQYRTIVARESYWVDCSACGTASYWGYVTVSNNVFVVPCP
jgi:hypothetical protein